MPEITSSWNPGTVQIAFTGSAVTSLASHKWLQCFLCFAVRRLFVLPSFWFVHFSNGQNSRQRSSLSGRLMRCGRYHRKRFIAETFLIVTLYIMSCKCQLPDTAINLQWSEEKHYHTYSCKRGKCLLLYLSESRSLTHLQNIFCVS